jgi:hypothetical protein
MRTYNKFFKESILDPVKKGLSEEVWTDDEKLRPEVKKQILDTLYDWLDQIDIKEKPQSVEFVGSVTGYQYTDDSDIDIGVQIPVSEEREKRLVKILPNGNLLKGTNHPVNYFIIGSEGRSVAQKDIQQAIYDILKDEWIKKPVPLNQDIKALYKAAIDQAVSWGRKIALDIDEMNRDAIELKMYRHFLESDEFDVDKEEIKHHTELKENELKADYDILKIDKRVLKTFRQEAYPPSKDPFQSRTLKQKPGTHPDFSFNNIVYKILEKFGYFKMIEETEEKYKKEFPEVLDVEE